MLSLATSCACSHMPGSPGVRAFCKQHLQPEQEPGTPASTPSQSMQRAETSHLPQRTAERAAVSTLKPSDASRLGLFGLAGFFGQRALLVVFGKKAAWGLFSILSLKKLLFLPAWIWLLFMTGGAMLPLACDRMTVTNCAHGTKAFASARLLLQWHNSLPRVACLATK